MIASLIAVLSLAGAPSDAGPGYLFKIDAGPDGATRFQGGRYQPQPGDILLFDDHNAVSAKLYRTCRTGGPLHAGIMFKKEDGTFGTLEAGPGGVMKVVNLDLEPRLRSFNGTILIRRLRTPLTPEQSTRLAGFATTQNGKPYAIGRLALQTIPVRLHTAQFAQNFGKTVLDRDRWFCSELVVAAAATAGIWPADAYPGNMMYPRDLCYDEHFDLSPTHETPALWYSRPELQRSGAGVRVINPNP